MSAVNAGSHENQSSGRQRSQSAQIAAARISEADRRATVQKYGGLQQSDDGRATLREQGPRGLQSGQANTREFQQRLQEAGSARRPISQTGDIVEARKSQQNVGDQVPGTAGRQQAASNGQASTQSQQQCTTQSQRAETAEKYGGQSIGSQSQIQSQSHAAAQRTGERESGQGRG